jgi:hypothetical protein
MQDMDRENGTVSLGHQQVFPEIAKMSQIMESPVFETPPPVFVDRRNPAAVDDLHVCERRQFSNSHDELSPEAAELARAIDQYKLFHRRRFITFEEMLGVIKSLGYSR